MPNASPTTPSGPLTKPRHSAKPRNPRKPRRRPIPPESPKKKLSYLEAREYESIEQRIHAAEQALEQKREAMQHAAMQGSRDLEQMHLEIETSAHEVESMYVRWAELEAKAQQ